MPKKIVTTPAPTPALPLDPPLDPVAAPVRSPFVGKDGRIIRQRAIHSVIVALMNGFLSDVVEDRLQPAQFRQNTEVFMRDLPVEDREYVLKTIDGLVGRLLGLLPRIPDFFRGEG